MSVLKQQESIKGAAAADCRVVDEAAGAPPSGEGRISPPASSWKLWLNQKICEGLVLMDMIWYQIMHIPWFLRNELNLLSHIDEFHTEFLSKREKKSPIGFHLMKSFGLIVRKLKRIIYGKDHEKNFYLRYGVRYANQRPRQTLNEYIPYKEDVSNRVYIFLHGGTWHSGHADLYHGFATFVAGQENHRCYNLNYSLYPSVHLEEMIEDVDRGVNFVIDRVYQSMKNPEIILVGHSAGAHLFSLVSLNKIYNIVNNIEPNKTSWKLEQVRKLVLLCGIYDMVTHYDYEKTRNVHDISPMWKACKGTHRFPLFSPTLIIRSNTNTNISNTNNNGNTNISSTNNGSNNGNDMIDEKAIANCKWPSTSIAHGKKDITCPWIQSQIFHQELSAMHPNSSIQFHPLDQFFHGDLITNFMGIERDFNKRDQIWKIINSTLN